MKRQPLLFAVATLIFVSLAGCGQSGPGPNATSTPGTSTGASSAGGAAAMGNDAVANNDASRANRPTDPRQLDQQTMPNAADESRSANRGSRDDADSLPPAATGRSFNIPSGTAIAVTADQAISSKTANAGERFPASLAAPVRVNGRTVIPSGARASLVVRDAKSAGKFNGNAALTVALDKITVNGRSYSVRSSSVTEAGKGRGKRTAIGAGGGAAFGAIVGAIAGGGKGAAIGAGAGAGAGTAGAAFTGNRDVVIEPETRLSFSLRAPIEIE